MKKKIIGISIVVLALVGYFGYNYAMAPPKDINNAKVDVEISAKTFALEFEKNETTATAKYDEKVVAVKGIVTGIEDKSVTLDNKVTCGFENKTELKK